MTLFRPQLVSADKKKEVKLRAKQVLEKRQRAAAAASSKATHTFSTLIVTSHHHLLLQLGYNLEIVVSLLCSSAVYSPPYAVGIESREEKEAKK